MDAMEIELKKSMLILPQYQAPITIGSQVVIIDGSYTLSINSDSFTLAHDDVGRSDDVYMVVAVNVNAPSMSDNIDNLLPGDKTACGSLIWSNNCIIKNTKGNIIFCSIGNISNIKGCGKNDPPYTLKRL